MGRNSVFWARLFGYYTLILSIGNLWDPEHSRTLATGLMADPDTLMLAGLFTLMLGLAVVVKHTVFRGWPIIITIVGYWIVAKGLMLMFRPQWIEQLTAFWQDGNVYLTIVPALVFGLILLYCGYFPKEAKLNH